MSKAEVLAVKEFNADGEVIDEWTTREFPADRHHEVLGELIHVLDGRLASYEIALQDKVVASNRPAV